MKSPLVAGCMDDGTAGNDAYMNGRIDYFLFALKATPVMHFVQVMRSLSHFLIIHVLNVLPTDEFYCIYIKYCSSLHLC